MNRPATALVPTAAVLVGMALLCTLSALDRADRSGLDVSPILASTGFGAAGQRGQALTALGQKDAARVIAFAGAALDRAPIDPAALSLLGGIMSATGADAKARAVFTVATQAGWRELPTQAYWLHVAEEIEDWQVASERLDAIARTTSTLRPIIADIQTIEQTDAGQRALATRLALNPGWGLRYQSDFTDLADDAVLDNRVATLRDARGMGLSIDCSAAALPARALASRGNVARAARFWFGTCGDPRHDPQSLSDGSFEEPVADNPSPFAWTLIDNAIVTARIDDAPPGLSGHALSIRSTSSTTEPVARQIVQFAPGTHDIIWKSASGGQTASSITFTTKCLSSRATIGATDVPGRPTGARITIPASGCAAQMLTINVRPSSRPGGEQIWIDDLSVSPVRQGQQVGAGVGE